MNLFPSCRQVRRCEICWSVHTSWCPMLPCRTLKSVWACSNEMKSKAFFSSDARQQSCGLGYGRYLQQLKPRRGFRFHPWTGTTEVEMNQDGARWKQFFLCSAPTPILKRWNCMVSVCQGYYEMDVTIVDDAIFIYGMDVLIKSPWQRFIRDMEDWSTISDLTNTPKGGTP